MPGGGNFSDRILYQRTLDLDNQCGYFEDPYLIPLFYLIPAWYEYDHNGISKKNSWRMLRSPLDPGIHNTKVLTSEHLNKKFISYTNYKLNILSDILWSTKNKPEFLCLQQTVFPKKKQVYSILSYIIHDSIFIQLRTCSGEQR